jgi:hypothetical protein
MRATPVFALAAVLAACAPTTEVVSSWKDPAVTGPIQFKKVLMVCACKDDGMRRTVEDQLAKHVKNSQPSYTLVSDDQLRDRDAAKAAVRDGGFDGAVVVMLVNVDRTSTYVPGTAYAVPPAYGTMWGGWGYGWSTMYDPGYVREDQYVDFNTNVYSVEQDKLVWASRTQTQNPSSVPSLVDEIVAATVQEMKKQKVMN